MRHYPVYLDLSHRKVLVVGGGTVALQKLPALLEAEARVVVVAPDALPEIARFANEGRLLWHRRRYEPGDLEGSRLVIAATDDEALQRSIACACRGRGIWINVVDVPPLCDFIAPAVVRRGLIQLAISTGGAAPALAKYLRKKWESAIGPEYAEFAALVGRRRPDILKLSKERRLALWDRLVTDEFFQTIRDRGIAQAEARLDEWLSAHDHVSH